MAMNTVSQIKINNTSYDICDYEARHKIGTFYEGACSFNDDITISSLAGWNGHWDTDGFPQTNEFIIYLGYKELNTGSNNVYVYLLSSYSSIGFMKNISQSVTIRPTAIQVFLVKQTF